jgi:hypothetical protein
VSKRSADSVFALLIACVAWASAASGAAYQVTLDTSQLSGQAQIAFDFIDGGSPLNTVTLSGFSPAGAFSNPSATGDAAGTLPGPITLGGTQFFSELLATINLGGTISFVLEATTVGPDAGNAPDAFSLFLLDPDTGLPLSATTDPTGSGALLLHEVDGTSPGRISIYSGIVTQPVALSLDVDASVTATEYDAFTDGLLVIRYLFGLTGPSLTTGALGGTAGRTDPVTIKAYLDGIRPALDIDGNGSADALTDGLLIVRYLSGLRGTELIAGAADPLGIRKTAPDIEFYLQALLP